MPCPRDCQRSVCGLEGSPRAKNFSLCCHYMALLQLRFSTTPVLKGRCMFIDRFVFLLVEYRKFLSKCKISCWCVFCQNWWVLLIHCLPTTHPAVVACKQKKGRKEGDVLYHARRGQTSLLTRLPNRLGGTGQQGADEITLRPLLLKKPSHSLLVSWLFSGEKEKVDCAFKSLLTCGWKLSRLTHCIESWLFVVNTIYLMTDLSSENFES